MSTHHKHKMPKSAIVLAAGFGTRLRPVTANLPKPLVKINGRTMLDYCLDRLKNNGVTTAVVNINYLGQLIIDHVMPRTEPQIIISDERTEFYDSGGGVQKALAYFKSDDFFVINGDSLWLGDKDNTDMLTMAEVWDPTKMSALLLLVPYPDITGYAGEGDYSLHDDGRIIELTRRTAPSQIMVYGGTAILNKQLFGKTHDKPFKLQVLFTEALRKGRLYGVISKNQCLHISQVSDINIVEQAIAKHPQLNVT